MSELIEALILGIVQGLTEFLPVSSSGHLEIFKVLLNDDSIAKQSLFTTVLLHFATALSTIVIFRKEIGRIIHGLFSVQFNEEKKFSFLILLSMIPAALVGLIWDDMIESLFSRNLILVGLMLLITSALLFLSDRNFGAHRKLDGKSAFGIGLAQAIAILPGISRSGATISTALMLGLNREEAASFSFLMVIPLIFGKMAKDILDGSFLENMPSLGYATVGFFAAFISGLLACTWMIALVKKAGLKYFGLYCIIIAVFILLYQFSG